MGDVLEASEEHVAADGGLELDVEDDGVAAVAEGDPPCGVCAPELGAGGDEIGGHFADRVEVGVGAPASGHEVAD